MYIAAHNSLSKNSVRQYAHFLSVIMGTLRSCLLTFLVFLVVLVVIELSEKNNAHVQFGHEGRPNLVSWGETSIYVNCLVLFAHLLLPLLHHPFGAAARRVRPLGPWQAGASLVQLALLHLPECGSLFLSIDDSDFL